MAGSNPAMTGWEQGLAPRHPEKAGNPDTPILRKPDWLRVKAPVSVF